jgi:hypothetical protein
MSASSPLGSGFGLPFIVHWFFDLIMDQPRAVIKNGDGKRRETGFGQDAIDLVATPFHPC